MRVSGDPIAEQVEWIRSAPIGDVVARVATLIHRDETVDNIGTDTWREDAAFWSALGMMKPVTADALLDWASERGRKPDHIVRICRLLSHVVDTPQRMRRLWLLAEPHIQLDDYGSIIEDVSSRVVTPEDVLVRLLDHLRIDDIAALASHPNVPLRALEIAVEIAREQNGDDIELKWVASSPRLTRELAVAVIESQPYCMPLLPESGLSDEELMSLDLPFSLPYIAPRIARRFGISDSNTNALASLAALEWWTLGSDSPEVEVVKTLSPDCL